MLKVNPHILTTLRHRFDEQVSEADILAWLYNFDEADWTVALTLLNQVSFYSETRCADVLEDGLKRRTRQTLWGECTDANLKTVAKRYMIEKK